jgi:hypothetical protein
MRRAAVSTEYFLCDVSMLSALRAWIVHQVKALRRTWELERLCIVQGRVIGRMRCFKIFELCCILHLAFAACCVLN